MRLYTPFILSVLFLTMGIWLGYQSFEHSPPQSVARKILAGLGNEVERLDQNAAAIIQDFQARGDTILEDSYKHPFYIYNQQSVIAWSSNSIVPPVHLVTDTFSIRLLKTSGGDYVVKKWNLNNEKFLVGLIPLFRQYTIRNDYLRPEWNYDIFPKGNISILDPNATIGLPICIQDECVFKVSFLQEEMAVNERTKGFAIFFITAGIILLLVKGVQYVLKMGRRSPERAFLILLAGLWAIRFGLTSADFPGLLLRFPLFDPQHFASSDLNRSMGDLFLNIVALFGLCFYLFRNYYRFSILKAVYNKPVLKGVLAVVCGIIYFFTLLFPFVVIQTIYNNSAVVFDISQSLQFDALRITALGVLILSWVCTFLVSHVCVRMLVALVPGLKVFVYLAIAAILFASINELSGQRYFSTLLIAGVYFVIVNALSFYNKLQKISYTTFTYLFTTIVALSLISTVAIQHFTRKERIENQFRFASNFLIDRDHFAEYLLQDVLEKINHDVFIQTRISSPFFSKDAIRQKVRQVFVPSYFNKYDIEILLFGAGGDPIGNQSGSTFSELLNTYNQEASRTAYDGVYFVNSPASDITQRYLMVAPIIKSGVTLGYVVLELLLKRIIPENVYPELLIDSRFQHFYRTEDMSYAVYGRDIVFSSGSFNYERLFRREFLGDPAIHLKGVERNGYTHVALEDENNRVAVVSSPVTPPVYLMANFSFSLVLGLSLLLIFIVVQGLITFMRGKTLFFSARIQLVLNLAFFLPLFIVSVTTLQLTSLTSQEQLNADYISKSKSFGAQVEAILDDYTQTDDVNRIDFQNQLTDLAKLFNLDANVYAPKGHLMASSQPLIFENGLIAPYTHPEAIRRINQGDDVIIAREHIGNLNYFVSVASLKSPQTGKLIGILALPFFQSLSSLERIQIKILANILNVFAVIFIALIILSYVVSEWLTFPLRFITRSLSRTTLTRVNQPLTWNANDEIGMMVKEYNQMLYKLSESKAELEQTQRERAWREIAQQVAHEIKNPLTPMKLTLQQLERSMKSGDNVKEKISKSLPSLLQQVDILNDIASSFSTFVKMPEPEIQRLELVTLLKRVTDLHSQSGTINLKLLIQEVFVMGDAQLLGRIFSNIILNAFQSARPGVKHYVDISVETSAGICKISFYDNGKGIDKKVADRVFFPYFSTKRSGSGLGLAISRQGIEQMGGKIWFESEPEDGTTFFIELPVAKDV